MTEKNPMVRSLSVKVLVILLVALAIGVFISNNPMAFVQGIGLGGIFTLLKVQLMNNTMNRAVTKEPEAAKRFVQAHYMLRYLLSVLVLFVGIVTPTIDSIAVIIALLSLKAAAYWQGLTEPRTPLDGSVEFLEWEDDDEPSDF